MNLDLKIVEFLQSLSNPVFDFFFKMVTHLGDEIVFIVVAAIIYWTIDKRFAFKFAMTYMFSALVNTLFKSVVQRPRPYTYPTVDSIGVETSGTSFPSGHAQASGVLSFSLYKLNEKKYKWLNELALFILIIVPISRIYLGQHFLTDVIVGTVIGIGIAIGVFKLFDVIGDKEHIYALYLIPLFLVALFVKNEYVYIASGGFIAFTLGYYVEKLYVKHDVNTTLLNKILKIVLGLVIAFGIKEGFKFFIPETLWGDFIRYFSIGLWAALGAPWVFKHVFKNRK